MIYRLLTRITQPAATFAIAVLLSATTASQAADTDIFFNQPVDAKKPNVIFLLDNSRSMRTAMQERQPYSPTTNYNGDFERNSLYLVSDGRIPAIPRGLSKLGTNKNHCKAARTSINLFGYASVRLAARIGSNGTTIATGKTWFSPIGVDLSGVGANLECAEDRGVHGKNGSGSNENDEDSSDDKTYASNQLGDGWVDATESEKHLDWSNFNYTTVFKGNYLNYVANPPTQSGKRLGVLQEVARNVARRFPHINLGLSVFNPKKTTATNIENRYAGGSILLASKDNAESSHRDSFINEVNALTHESGTTLAESLYEIQRYLNGSSMHFGVQANTDADALTSGSSTYDSPVRECQKNYVVVVTDGVPFSDEQVRSLRSGGCAGSCLDEIAGDMKNGAKAATVYPVGFALDGTTANEARSLLDAVAQASETRRLDAQNPGQLENQIADIVSDILFEGTSFVTLSSSSNQFNRVSNREFVYLGMFTPSNRYQWQGNLKKYRIAYDSNEVPYLTDQQSSDPKIVDADGRLSGDAHSYWSTDADGANVLAGGARERLLSNNNRQIMSNVGDDTSLPLSNAAHVLSTTNNSWVAELDSGSTQERNDWINYALGQDLRDEDGDSNTTEQRGHMGGIFRSQPIALQFGDATTTGEANVLVFAATTDGVLHAFKDTTGDEHFAFIPKEAAPFLDDQYVNRNSQFRWWGLDGSLRALVNDTDANGIIQRSAGDWARLYVSMGLGARGLYALDITDAGLSTPVVKQSGYISESIDNDDSPWKEVGHILDPVQPINIIWKGNAKTVLLFNFGYDISSEDRYSNSNMGRGLGITDAKNLDHMWSVAGNSAAGNHTEREGRMKFAFASAPTTIDLDGDGFKDRIYAVDIIGQVWRFDITQVSDSDTKIQGGRIATLGNNSDGNRRRTYKRIAATLVNNGEKSFVALAIGTGDRMNPLNDDTQDRLYLLHDYGITSSRDYADSNLIQPSDLYDATQNTIQTGGSSQIRTQHRQNLAGKSGWYIDLPTKEKAISSPTIIDGLVYFPVYRSPEPSSDCFQNNGLAKLYRMRLKDATSPLSNNNRIAVEKKGMSTDVNLHVSPTGKKAACMGPQCVAANINENNEVVPESDLIRNHYWYTK